MGEVAENLFSKLLSKRGKVRPASFQQQMKHVDFIVSTKTGDVRYEVKSRKRVNRSGDAPTDETVWIEFLNVRGDAGWLYGKADYLAFEREHDFVIVDREDLRAMAELKCDLALKVNSAGEALYRGYTRWGRNDLLSMVYMSDIIPIAEEIWKKNS